MDNIGFFESRRDFFRLTVRKDDDGWNVWLRIDGTYHDEAMALDAAEYLKRAIEEELE